MPSKAASLTVIRSDAKPKEGEAVYKPLGNNLAVFYSREPEVLLEGPAGTGKSRAALELLHLRALKYPRSRHAIVRQTRESLTQSALVTYEQEVMVPPQCIPFHHESQEYRYPNGSRVIVGGLDKVSRIFSSQYDTIYVQEATEALLDDIEALTTRLRNGVLPYQQLVMDCNPDGPDHWLNKRCATGVTRRLETRHEDNPTVTPEYLARLDALTGWRYKRLRLGQWVSAEGQYFAEWDPDLHICEPFDVPVNWTRWVSIDYGYADPFCALWFARNPSDKYHIYVYREAYSTGLRDEEQAKSIVKASGTERIAWYIGDPSIFNKRSEQNKPSIAAVYRQQGVRPLAPGVNERIAGWQTVRRALAYNDQRKPRLQVMRGRAPNLVRTLPSMVCDPLDSEDLADKLKSVKTEDHAVDCARYALMLEAMPPKQQAKLRDFEVVA